MGIDDLVLQSATNITNGVQFEAHICGPTPPRASVPIRRRVKRRVVGQLEAILNIRSIDTTGERRRYCNRARTAVAKVNVTMLEQQR